MHRLSLLEAGLARFDLEQLAELTEAARPRLLIVADGDLNFLKNEGFGLWRFLYSLLNGSGIIEKPFITLAHRKGHNPKTICIGSDIFQIKTKFVFTEQESPVIIENYDQLWLFGFDGGDLSISNDEIKVIAEFMNCGGGVFAAGDHSNLGQGMCGKLPRIQCMRDWERTPMGTEPKIEDAVKRIDTVVNPGADNEFQFDDQSDNIPQRIYPNYTVTRLETALRWQAIVHRLLLLPGAPEIRTGDIGSSNFKLDIDVLPDHPHESVCYAVTGHRLCQLYKQGGLKFDEFPVSAKEPGKRIEAEIVAFAVSGGRSVFHKGAWKPPVVPQMFGVISAYDGQEAKPYPDARQPPGRIVCDSSWHHHVNFNLDGTGSTCIDRNGLQRQCTGLGSWSGNHPGEGTFTPSPDLEKIFIYYRNTVRWLQPANKGLLTLLWTLVAVRYHPMIIEELLEAPRLTEELLSDKANIATLRGFVGLGLEASRITNLTTDAGYLKELTTKTLLGSQSAEASKLIKILISDEAKQTYLEPDVLLHGVVGLVLAFIATILHETDSEAALDVLQDGYETRLGELMTRTMRLLTLAFNKHNERVSHTNALNKKIAKLLKLS